MGNIWVLFKNNIRVEILKKKGEFILVLLAPMLILLLSMKVFASSSGYYNVAVFDNDNTVVSRELIDTLKETEAINIVSIDKDEVEESFSDNTIYASIEINKGFQEDLLNGTVDEINVITKENDNVDDMIKGILGEQITNLKNLAAISGNDIDKFSENLSEYKEDGKLDLERKSLSDLSNDYEISIIFVGFLIFFMLVRGSAGAQRYYQELDENVFGRLFMAPIKTWQYYLADVLSNFVVVSIQGVMGILWIKIVGVNLGVSYGNLLIILLVVGLLSVMIAVCLRAFLKDSSAFNMAYNFVTMILVMLGGCFVPLEMLSKNMNKMSYFNPVRWAIDALTSLQQGQTLIDVLPKIGIVLLFSIAFFIMAIYKTRKDDKNFV